MQILQWHYVNICWMFLNLKSSVEIGIKKVFKDEKKYKRDFLRTVILLKEIKFFSDHLFKERYQSNNPVAILQKHIDNQIYLKYDFIPLNLLRESLESFSIYCKDNPELSSQHKKLKKDLDFVNHLRNKVSAHLSDEALDKMIQWNPDIYDGRAGSNTSIQEYEIYRAMMDVAINSYLDEKGQQKQFGIELDIELESKVFYTYLLDTVNLAIRFLEEIQNILKPNIKYIKLSESTLSKEERSNYLEEAIRITLEIADNPTKKETLLPRMAEILRMFGIDPEPYGETGHTDFRFKTKHR